MRIYGVIPFVKLQNVLTIKLNNYTVKNNERES